MKRRFKRLAAGGCILFLSLSLFGCGKGRAVESTEDLNYQAFEKQLSDYPRVEQNADGETEPITLEFWYSDLEAAAYYEAAALDFYNRYDIKVNCSSIDDVDYLDMINAADVRGKGPDVFSASNDRVRKIQLAGLSEPNALYTQTYWNNHFPEITRHAMVSDGKLYGYPTYMDTCVMIYDTALTTQPNTFEDITNFAVNFEDDTNSKVVFRFDMSDPFVDYMFLGTDAVVMGIDGEDTSSFQVVNDSVVSNMSYFQSLHDYFSIDAEDSSYAKVKQELEEGRLIYGIVRTDVISEIGTYAGAYKIGPVPALTADKPIQPLSVTYGAFVSTYSKHKEYANLFAAFLSCEYASHLYEQTRYIATCEDIERTSEEENIVYDIYTGSISSPKALESGDFWLYMEICFKNIWNRQDVTQQLQNVQDAMSARL